MSCGRTASRCNRCFILPIPALQHFEEKTKGSLEVGKRADFAILSANLLTMAPATIKDIKVVETIKDGKTVFEAPGS